MKHKVRKLNFAMIAGVVVALVLAVTVAFAATVNVDDFSTFDPNLSASSGSVSVAQGDTETSILGGERDVVLTFVSGSGTVQLDVNTTTEHLEYSAGPSARGEFEITWDGNDDDASTRTYVPGLSVDLTDSGTNEGFLIYATEADHDFSFAITVYEDGTNYSTSPTIAETNTPFLEGGRGYYVPFTDFTDTGGGANFADAEAIVLFVDGSIADGLDLVIDFFNVVSNDIFDYGDLPGTSPDYAITTSTDSGAAHIIGSLYLGSSVDGESDGQEDDDAGRTGGGDDGTGSDDEDGVTFSGDWSSSPGTITVDVTGGQGCLFGWMDYLNDVFGPSSDGDFDDPTEYIIQNQPVSGSGNVFNPAFFGNLSNRTIYARFRLVPDADGDGDCTDQEETIGYQTVINNGEVEDYEIGFSPTAITLESLSATPGAQTQPILWVSVLLIVASGGLLVFRRQKVKAANK